MSTLGPVLLDVEGTSLNAGDIERLTHPQTGGVIFFGRNFQDSAQLKALTAEIRSVRPELLLTVDHEGGRVQRFREGFTIIPPMRALGRRFDHAPIDALADAKAIGIVIASELVSHGLDFSFAPVLDLDYGASTVIGERALHSDPLKASLLAVSLQQGFHLGGMATVGKHFPGHGHVSADSHVDIPIDTRSLAEIEQTCLMPYVPMIASGLGGVMPAHVQFVNIDPHPAGFSPFWLQHLRTKLGFDGMIFSDDLTMEGASVVGDHVDRAHAALNAGCDMVLLCNDSAAAARLLDGLSTRPIAPSLVARQARMRRKFDLTREAGWDAVYRAAVERVQNIPV
jgi:beta-N-acetylhexosaminidase